MGVQGRLGSCWEQWTVCDQGGMLRDMRLVEGPREPVGGWTTQGPMARSGLGEAVRGSCSPASGGRQPTRHQQRG